MDDARVSSANQTQPEPKPAMAPASKSEFDPLRAVSYYDLS